MCHAKRVKGSYIINYNKEKRLHVAQWTIGTKIITSENKFEPLAFRGASLEAAEFIKQLKT